MPSLSMFFRICEYLDSTPNDFFGEEEKKEESVLGVDILNDLETLTPEQITCICYLIKELKQKG